MCSTTNRDNFRVGIACWQAIEQVLTVIVIVILTVSRDKLVKCCFLKCIVCHLCWKFQFCQLHWSYCSLFNLYRLRSPLLFWHKLSKTYLKVDICQRYFSILCSSWDFLGDISCYECANPIEILHMYLTNNLVKTISVSNLFKPRASTQTCKTITLWHTIPDVIPIPILHNLVVLLAYLHIMNIAQQELM